MSSKTDLTRDEMSRVTPQGKTIYDQKKLEAKLNGRTFEIESGERNYRGGKAKGHAITQKTTGFISRVLSPLANLAGGLGLVVVPFSNSYRKDTVGIMKDGKKTDMVYESQVEKIPVTDKLIKTLGYHPNKQSSIVRFLKAKLKNGELPHDDYGNYFWLENRRPGQSSFLFVPQGDWNKAKSVLYWTSSSDPEKNGTPVKNSKEQLQAVRSYGAAIQNIDEEWEKEVPKLALQLGKERNKERKKAGLQAYKLEEGSKDMKALIKEVKAERGPVTISSKDPSKARIYGKHTDLNVSMCSYRTGTVLKLSDDVTKDIERIHNQDMEHKSDLGGRYPGKSPANRGPTPIDEKGEDDESIDSSEDGDVYSDEDDENAVDTSEIPLQRIRKTPGVDGTHVDSDDEAERSEESAG